MTADEWMQVKRQGVAASKEEMRRYMNSPQAKATVPTVTSETLPWSHEEELVARHKTGDSRGYLRQVLWCLAAAGIVTQMLRQALHGFGRGQAAPKGLRKSRVR
eukprot:g1221.t1